MSVAELVVSPELMREVLRLPEDCEIWGDSPHGFHIGVNHKDIPHNAGLVRATYRSKGGKVEFAGWEAHG